MQLVRKEHLSLAGLERERESWDEMVRGEELLRVRKLREAKQVLSESLASLSPRERRIIEMRYGMGDEHSQTLDEIGTQLGLTKERIRQIEKKALSKLRHSRLSRKLIDYLY